MHPRPTTRGVLVLDSTTVQLRAALEVRNILIVAPEPDRDGKLGHVALAGRIVVTTKPDEYHYDASSYDLGIIAVDRLPEIDASPDPDTNKTAKLISDALVDRKLWGLRHGFLLRLRADGDHEYEDLVD